MRHMRTRHLASPVLLGAILALSGCPENPPPTDTGPMSDVPVIPTDVPEGTDVPVVPTDAPTDGGTPAAARTLPTNGSAIAINAASDVIVAANRQAGTISVFDLDATTSPPTLTRTADIAVAGAEPWQVVIGNDDDSAYVILRATQEVVRVVNLHATPALALVRGSTGAEPTGIAISPLGDRIYAANWGEGTISVFNAALTELPSIDLNDALVDTGVLGTVAARPGLAHPRALAMTNDGDTDQADETLYATEYFGQNRTDTAGLPTDGSEFDIARVGFVYRVSFAGAVGAAISLAPVSDTGFADSLGNVTGCFPNQLQTATINSGRLYVAGVCASPRGPTGPVLNPDATLMNPANFKTEVHSTLWVVDTTTNTETVAQRVVLTDAFNDRFAAMTVPDDGTRRYPLIPTDFAFVPASNIGYLTAYGSDAVFRVRFNPDGSFVEVGATAAHFINLAPAGMPAGRLPLGIAIASGTSAFTINEVTRNVSIIGFGTQAVLGAVEATPLPAAGSAEEDILTGRRFFVTGLGRWSFRGQAWNSCEGCHGDGLTDNVTWFFGRGPRQSTSLDGSYGPTGDRRLYNWTAIFDETHDFELNTRGNSGGVGAIVHAASTPAVAGDRIHFDGSATVPPGNMATAAPQAGLTGSTTALMPGGAVTPSSVLRDWDEIDAYLATIRSPRQPTNLTAADVTAGRALFEANGCAGCHGTDMWTTSRVFYTPGAAATGATGSIRTATYTRPSGFPAGLNPPSAGGATILRGTTGGEQINCILSAVGTFPATGTAPILPTGSTVLTRELRTDMIATAQGATGFNPPALIGVSTGAPYFHAGNARTLEEVFDPIYAAHYQAFSSNFLDTGDRAAQVRQMIAFLLSIDEDTAVAAAPALGFDPTLCPDTL
jgi:DNA-binding beta-propeller fold protein YncE